MNAKYALAGCALVNLLGCGRGEQEATSMPTGDGGRKILVERSDNASKLPPGVGLVKARPADAPDRVDRKPSVSDDAKEIAEVRDIYKREIDGLFEASVKRVKDGEMLFSEHEDVFRHRKARAVADLKRIMTADPTASEQGRCRAALVLIRLGDSEGEQFLFDSLRSDRALLRTAALKMLRAFEIKPDFSNPDRARLALSLIDDPDPDVARAARDLCATRKVPGTEAKLLGLHRPFRQRLVGAHRQ